MFDFGTQAKTGGRHTYHLGDMRMQVLVVVMVVVVVVVVLVTCSTVCMSTAVNAMQQSLGLIELITCVMSSLLKLAKNEACGRRQFSHSFSNLPLYHNRDIDDHR